MALWSTVVQTSELQRVSITRRGEIYWKYFFPLRFVNTTIHRSISIFMSSSSHFSSTTKKALYTVEYLYNIINLYMYYF